MGSIFFTTHDHVRGRGKEEENVLALGTGIVTRERD